MEKQGNGNPTGTMPEVGQARRLDVPLTSNHDVASPLRYPGGKTVLSGFVATLIERLGMQDPTYVEPYAGGAGVALRLLRENRLSRIVINDYDRHVYAFWNGAVNHPADFLARLDAVEPTMEEWHRQCRIIRDPSDEGETRVRVLLPEQDQQVRGAQRRHQLVRMSAVNGSGSWQCLRGCAPSTALVHGTMIGSFPRDRHGFPHPSGCRCYGSGNAAGHARRTPGCQPRRRFPPFPTISQYTRTIAARRGPAARNRITDAGERTVSPFQA